MTHVYATLGVVTLAYLTGACSAPKPAAPLKAPELTVSLVSSQPRDGSATVSIYNTDQQYAICMANMPSDSTVRSFIRAYSADGAPIPYRGERPQSGFPAAPYSVVYIRAGERATRLLSIEDAFPGSLAVGACLELRVHFANCRALEVWDLQYPPETSGLLPGEGLDVTYWRAGASGELTKVQRCSES